MIRILDSNLTPLGVLQNASEASCFEQINGEYTVEVEAVLDEKLNRLVDENSIFELNSDYFDIAYFNKTANEDGTHTLHVEAEHVSYHLNNPEYNREYFTETGTPDYILGQILEGTGFTAGTVEYPNVETYSLQEPASRRQILMEFAALLKCEVIFDKFTISLVAHRGLSGAKPVIMGRNVRSLSKTVDKRKTDDNGQPLVSYKCTPIFMPDDSYSLGDDVLLIHNDIGLKEELRVVSIGYNPYDKSDVTLEFANYTNGMEDSIYRIETQSVVKDALMNGIRIGPEFGFEAVRNDKRARAYYRSDAIAMQSGNGSGESWRDRLYYEYDSELDETYLVFDGKLSVDVLEVISGMVTPYVYSDNGAIVNAIVRRLRTDLSKPWRFLQNDKSDVHYQEIGDSPSTSGYYMWVDSVVDGAEPVQFSITALNGGGEEVPLWWFEGRKGEKMTTNPEYAKGDDGEPVPVMVYLYSGRRQWSKELKLTPEGYWGVEDLWGSGEDEYKRGAGKIAKTTEYMQMVMHPGLGSEIGGIRISINGGTELYSKQRGMWLPYNGSGGLPDWDVLSISENFEFFEVEAYGETYRFELSTDGQGRISGITDAKARTVNYV